MAKFKKCPRCDINYIISDQEYCDICIAEMNGISLNIEDDDESELCPRCKQNFIAEGEKLCENCLAEQEKTKSPAVREFDWPDEEPVIDTETEEETEDIFIPDEVSLEVLVEEEEWDDDDVSLKETINPEDAFPDELPDIEVDSDIDDDSELSQDADD
ncbi:MAG: hypothetical protein LBU04_02600 [Christensenellaceae bacterium]|nr:hypothetical protein [Christensenellaceae bacterium]